MAFAKLSIDLEARLAQFEQGMQRAAAVTEANAKRMSAALGIAKAGVLGLAAGAASALASLQVKADIDQLDQLNQLSERYGITVEKLSEYRYAGRIAGTTTEDLIRGMGQLAMKAAAGAEALTRIGIATRDADGNLRSTDDLLGDLADRFRGFQDDAAKTALAMELFGESGAGMIPLLNQGRAGIKALADETRELGGVFDTEASAAARQLNDNLARLQLSAEALRISFLSESGIVKSLADFTDQLIQARRQGNLFAPVLERLKDLLSGKLTFDFTFGTDAERASRTAAEAMGKAADEVRRLKQVAEQNPGDRVVAGLLNQATARFESAREASRKATQALADSLGGRDAGGGRGFVNPALVRPDRVSAPIKPPPEPKATKPQADRTQEAFEQLLTRIQSQSRVLNAEVQEQIRTGQELSASDRQRISLLAELESSSRSYTEAQRAEGRAAIEALGALQQQADELAKQRQIRLDAARLQDGRVQALYAEAAAVLPNIVALRQEAEAIGLNEDQQRALAQARLDSQAAAAAQALLSLQNADASEAELDAQTRLAEGLRRLAEAQRDLDNKRQALAANSGAGAQRALDDYLTALQRRGDAAYSTMTEVTRQAEDALQDVFMGGKDGARRFVDYLIAQFVRLKVVQPIIQNLLGPAGSGGAGGIFGAISSLFGFAQGGAFAPAGVQAFANGGVVTSPTLFKFAAGGVMRNGVMGEVEPEAIMPLKRGPDGRLGVEIYGQPRASAAAAPISVQYGDIHVGDGVSLAQVRQAMEVTKQSTIAEIANLKRRGVMA